MTAGWHCPAYGPEGVRVGALCFFADLNTRACNGEEVCGFRLAAERRRIFAAIQAGAAAGDPDMKVLAAEFTHPGQLLSAGDGDSETP
jgi:hypothetical protein